MLPDFERADAIGSYWGNPKTRTLGELLIDWHLWVGGLWPHGSSPWATASSTIEGAWG
jgi:hypothetical protein